MKNLSAILLGVLVLCIASSASALTLANRGQSDYSIVIPNDLSVSDPEMTAGKELQSYLRQVTGASFTIRNETAAAKSGGPRILVGQSRTVKRLLPDVEWDRLAHDTIVIRTIGKDLILAGGKPRGTLYAVYTFLEDTVGVRWWTSTESYVPTKKTLAIHDLNTFHTPQLLYREAYYDDTNGNPLFAAKLKLNGHFTAIPETHGGHYTVLGWCHTAYALIPPGQYFGAHPDWFSEINGKRSADWGQLCFSNDEMRKELTKNALEWISKNPNAGIISISQNDWAGNCQCAKCKAADTEEGSPSGSLIRFINKVAEDIEKKYPDMLVETLAYQYTRKPPLHVKPRRNVVVRLCSIECNFLYPLESDRNAGFRDDILKWAAISPNLYIWNYVTDFAAYIQPHPNMRALAPDIRFFEKNNTIGIFEQGNPGCTIGDFDRMRAWLLAHVMWDSSRDERKLMTEFMNGYYGAAGPYLQHYLDLVADAAEKRSMHLGCYNGDLGFLSLEVMNQATELFAKAAQAVAGDFVLSDRVRRERLALDHMWLRKYDELKVAAQNSNMPFGGPSDPMRLCKEFVDLAHRWKNRNATEGQSFDSYVPSLEIKFMPVPTPEELDKLPADSKFEIQEDQCQLIGAPDWVQKVEDPAASNGFAARMPGSHTQWATQYAIPESLARSWDGKWRVYMLLRGEPQDRGCTFRFGIHDNAAGFVAMMDRAFPKTTDGKYRTFALGTHKLTDTMYIWLSPVGDGNTKGILCDRIVLVKEK